IRALCPCSSSWVMTDSGALVDTFTSRAATGGVAIHRGEEDGRNLSTTTQATIHQHTGRTFESVDELENALKAEKYIADRGLATTRYLMLKLREPLLLEGEAGVGKTEMAKVLSSVLDTTLIRLQCYEGLDASAAIYEWDYPRQMLYLQTLEATGGA